MSVPVLFLAAALATAAVSPQTASAPPRPSSNASDDRLATLAPPARVAVEGCIEREITGKPTDIGERTGLNNHFVLTSARVLKGKAPAAARTAAGAATYRIDGLSDEQLTVHVGRRVRIDGTFGSIDRAAAPDDARHGELLELTATTVRQIPGECAIPKS